MRHATSSPRSADRQYRAWRARSASHFCQRVFGAVECRGAADQLVEQQLSLEVELDESRDVAHRVRGAGAGAEYRFVEVELAHLEVGPHTEAGELDDDALAGHGRGADGLRDECAVGETDERVVDTTCFEIEHADAVVRGAEIVRAAAARERLEFAVRVEGDDSPRAGDAG